MNGPRTVVGKALRDTTEQALEHFTFARGQAGEERSEHRRSRGQDGVGRTRAGLSEHERDRAAIRTLLPAQKPARLETVDQPNGRRLRPAHDAGEVVHGTAGPRLQMNKSAGLRLG